MTMELPQENPLFPLEEQYEVAAWHSTIKSLSRLWAYPEFHSEASHIPKMVHALAKAAFKDPLDLLPITEQNLQGSYPVELIDLNILVHNRNPYTRVEKPILLNKTLALMLDLHYANDTTLNRIAHQAGIDRFEADVDQLTDFNTPRLHEAITESYSLVNTIRTIQHDNIFYLGKWDNDRSLNTGK